MYMLTHKSEDTRCVLRVAKPGKYDIVGGHSEGCSEITNEVVPRGLGVGIQQNFLSVSRPPNKYSTVDRSSQNSSSPRSLNTKTG